MILTSVNGYTSEQIQDALLGKAGVIERRWRFELFDRNGNFIRNIRSIREGGGIRYVEGQSIRRGGNILIDEKSHTLVDDYFDYNGEDNFELELPNLYSQITHESPLLYWRMGATSGTSETDASGNSRTLTYAGAGFTLNQESGIQSAPENGSVFFDGASGYGSASHAAAFNVTNMSLEFWAKTDSTAAAGRIVERDDNDSNHCWVVFHALGELRFRIYIGGVAVLLQTGVFINDNIWHHIICTYDGVGLRAYVDGVQVGFLAQTGNLDSVTSGINVATFRNTGFFYEGWLDEVAFYGYALSPAQVRARYQAGSNQLYEVDFLHDQIKAYCAIKMTTVGDDGTYWAEFPRGLFNFIYPDRNVDAMGAYYDALIQDATAKLENKTVRSANYTIATSKKYREALTDIFTAAGFTSSQYSITTSTIAETTLPISKEFPIGTTYLYMMNELLKEMGYRQATANSDGIILLDPWVSSATRQPEFTFTTDVNSIVNTTLKQTTNLKDIYNEIFLKRQGSKGVAELVATAQITNASHPLSIGRVGYRTFSDLNAVAADQTTLQVNANRLKEEKGRISYKLAIKTPILCILNNDDFVRIIGITPPPLFSAAFLTPPDLFLVTTWFEPFSDVGDSDLECDFHLAA